MKQDLEMLIVAGPNGSGKTTLARSYSKQSGIVYIGADEIASTLMPDDPAAARIAAGREFSKRMKEHLAKRESMVVESTLSGRTFRQVLELARQSGFEVSIAFLFLETEDSCLARVKERVRKGGHHVPDEDVRRRFSRCSSNFWTIYRKLASSWVILYNGVNPMQSVAAGTTNEVSIRELKLFEKFMATVGDHEDG